MLVSQASAREVVVGVARIVSGVVTATGAEDVGRSEETKRLLTAVRDWVEAALLVGFHRCDVERACRAVLIVGESGSESDWLVCALEMLVRRVLDGTRRVSCVEALEELSIGEWRTLDDLLGRTYLVRSRVRVKLPGFQTWKVRLFFAAVMSRRSSMVPGVPLVVGRVCPWNGTWEAWNGPVVVCCGREHSGSCLLRRDCSCESCGVTVKQPAESCGAAVKQSVRSCCDHGGDDWQW